MDPDKTLQNILDMWAEDNTQTEEFTEQVKNLRNWIDKGGYAPNLGMPCPMYDRAMVELILLGAETHLSNQKSPK